jgi:hypothetical protein
VGNHMGDSTVSPSGAPTFQRIQIPSVCPPFLCVLGSGTKNTWDWGARERCRTARGSLLCHAGGSDAPAAKDPGRLVAPQNKTRRAPSLGGPGKGRTLVLGALTRGCGQPISAVDDPSADALAAAGAGHRRLFVGWRQEHGQVRRWT